MARALLFLACVLGCAAPLYAQAPSADPVEPLLRRFERVLNAGDRAALPPLFAQSVPDLEIQQHAGDLFTRGAIRTAVFLRDRAALEGVPEGDGYRLVVEFFIETPGRARVLTAGVDIQRPAGGALDSWRIVDIEGLSWVEGLYRLRLNTTAVMSARDLRIVSEDLVIAFQEGTVFLVECDEGVTGLVLIGRGEMRFSPASAMERGQLRLFAGDDALAAPFETAFIRMSPSDYRRNGYAAQLTPAPQDARVARRAQEVFRRESTRSFSVDLQDMSRDAWHLIPPNDDFLAEVDTRRFDTLTYSRASVQAEDVSLFRREDRRTIALYASVAKLAARGRFYSDDTSREYDVLDYDVEASIDPTARIHPGSHAPGDAHPLDLGLDDVDQAGRLAGRDRRHQRGIRPAPPPAPAQPEPDSRQHAPGAAAGFGPDAGHHLCRPPRRAGSRHRHHPDDGGAAVRCPQPRSRVTC